MDIHDLLLTLAEIAATFAGMVGIMVAFTTREGKLSPSDSLRVRVIIPISIFSAFLALVPTLILSVPQLADQVWEISTSLHLAFALGLSAYIFAFELRAGQDGVKKMQGQHRNIAWVVVLGVIALNLANLSGVFGPVQSGLYAWAVALLLLCGGIVFIGLIYQKLL